MARNEVKTDSWVRDLLKVANIPFAEQGGGTKELDEAFKTASKALSGKAGYPDFCAVVKDFVFVFENKADIDKHCKLDSKNCIDLENADSVKNYAVNGAIHYGKHLAKHTNYKKIIAIAVSGNEKRHKITPYFINENGFVTKDLKDLEDFIVFNEYNIEEYYTKEILKEQTNQEKTTEQLLKDAKELHEDLRNYGNLRDTEKPIVVSGILLALEEIKYKNFDLERLNADKQKSDGIKIYEAIADNLKRANVRPEVKKDKLLSQFSIIKDTPKINETNSTLGKTPLKHYTEFLYKRIYQNIKYTQTSEDILGLFYSEFMKYGGGDGQTLGIILTPKHICELFCDLVELKPNDVVFDPCCGTAGFLIAAMHNMLSQVTDETQRQHIKENQLFGIEEKPDMFCIATTNMIVRGDGKSNLENKDFLKQNPFELQKDIAASIGMMNPPYSQGSKANPNLYEIAFSEQLLDSLTKGAKAIVIIPQSAVTGKSKEEKAIKANILKKHTLEGVITCNKNTFYGVGTNPCIAIFTAWIPHHKDKICKFINYEDDGFEVQKHKGLVETIHAKDKKAHLLKVWRDEMEAESKFCVKTTIEAEDEWLHSFYYFNDEIPKYEDFDKTMADYLTFEFNMITHGRGYLFGLEGDDDR